MVTLWRERHGLCKSHFVERNWYMFPAKIFPAEIFRSLCRPNILELCRRIKNQNHAGRPDLLHATCSAAIASAPNTINSKHAPIGLLLGTIESCHAPSVARTTPIVDHRMGEQEATPSLDCVWPAQRFLNHFCKLMLRDGRCHLHYEINRALALMKCPGNEHLEGGAGSPAVTAAFDAVRSAAPDWRR